MTARPETLDMQKDVCNLEIDAQTREYRAGLLESQATNLRDQARVLRRDAAENERRLKRGWGKTPKEAPDA